MIKLGVNIDHVATMREVRQGIEPEPVFAALIVQTSGADSVVVHLREDRRHIKDRDVYVLKEVIKTKLNLEMSCAEEILEIASRVKPDQATLVPEKRQEITTEGGLDVISNFERIRSVKRKLEKQGVEVSLFIDPDEKQISAAKKLGIKMVELHTGRYADARADKEKDFYFKEIEAAVRYGKDKGLRIFAGHGLNYFNVNKISRIKGIEELNIGYSIVCRAVLVGLEQAISEMKALISG